MNDSATRRALLAATFVATVATAGSLYFSIGMGLYPCRLCWFQRILMYPLVVILGVATWENRFEAYRTVLPLAGLGWLVAAYHSYLQVVGTGGICTSVCATVQFQLFGLFTIPNLALIAFTLVLGLFGIPLIRDRRSD
jgi:disulfide bond formation protein DsbB